MPLLSQNCFVLRGRGDLYKCLCRFSLSFPSPFMLFSRALTPSAVSDSFRTLFAALHTKSHSAVGDFISEGKASVIRSKGFGKDASHLSVVGRMKGGALYVMSTSCHKEQPSLSMWHHTSHGGGHAAAPHLCSPRRSSQLSFSVLRSAFQRPLISLNFHLLGVPINLMSSQHRQSPCGPQAGLSD